MPSPFPGMDPYLEHPAIFPGLHDSMIAYLREALQSHLPEPYYAEIADRVWVEVSQRPIGPDVEVLRGERGETEKNEIGGVAVAVRAEPIVVTVPHDERRETRLEIFARMEDERLVTAIEVLSLSNKTPGEKGRDLYLQKQQEILDNPIHLIEIDLLRAGEHTTAVPLDRAIDKAGRFDYHVCTHRFDKFEDYFVYPVLLRQSLPEVRVPLLPGDADVVVDLQAVFQRSYDTGPYKRRVRYEDEPIPPLTNGQAEWAKKILISR